MQQQTIFDVIKKRDFQTLYQHKKEILTQNQYGYTPLIYAIVKKVDIGMIKALLSMQPDLEQTDKMGDTALKKAIKFQNADCVQLLLENGANIAYENIKDSPWYLASQISTEIADLLLQTKCAIRLTLQETEQEILDDLLYEEDMVLLCDKIKHLQSTEILYAFMCGFNYDDDTEPLWQVLQNPYCTETVVVALLDMFSDGDVREILQKVDMKIAVYIQKQYSNLW